MKKKGRKLGFNIKNWKLNEKQQQRQEQHLSSPVVQQTREKTFSFHDDDRDAQELQQVNLQKQQMLHMQQMQQQIIMVNNFQPSMVPNVNVQNMHNVNTMQMAMGQGINGMNTMHDISVANIEPGGSSQPGAHDTQPGKSNGHTNAYQD